LQNPIAAADSSDTILASGTREASPTDPQAPTKQTVPAPNPAAIELLNIQVSTLKNEVAQLSEQLVNLQKAFIEQKELLKDKKTVAVKHERRLINGKTSAKEDVGFTILGATNRALVIASGTETKTVPLGDALPDGAVFEGYDGKQIKTSTGFYIVQQ
jgi:N-acetyl-beta-hexosaminidase